MKSLISKVELSQSHDTQINVSNRLITGLRSMDNKEASALADSISAKLVEVTPQVGAGLAAYANNKVVQFDSQTAKGDFTKVLTGVTSLVGMADAPLRLKLPTDAELGDVDPAYLADRMATVLEDAGPKWKPLGLRVREASATYAARQQAFDVAVNEQLPLRNATAKLGELKTLNQEAAIFIRRNAKPGSPAFDGLGNGRKGQPRKKKAEVVAKPQPAPAPTPAPVKVTTPPASVPTPVVTQPPAPTPVAVAPQPSPTSPGGDATAIAPLVNGAIGSQLNGAAHS